MSDSCARPAKEEAADLARALRERLLREMERGVPGLAAAELEEAQRKARKQSGRQLNPAELLREIRRELGDCARCPLAKGRTNIVFGDGDPFARVMFVGEGPGEDEDAQGVPFVGKAGRLLTDIIEKGMKLKRSEVYIANIVKCRPPGNRDPEPAEKDQCFPFLDKQIEAIRPRVIVALGKVAAHALLNVETPISRLRGNWHEYKGIPVMPTFHPSYLLRNASAKREVWEDIKQVMERLGLPVSPAGGGE
ncbi:MAG TPA: uracil-DNA glycosylase [bacterium]|nr:uracil-DNA glycosylase [bacterium]